VRVNTLGPAYQQVVEIAKALSLRSDILVIGRAYRPRLPAARWTASSR